ncbi:SDR family oxidoreductase [Schumannella soli]|uniref:SDR family oxidoreductase n=1 Tax=Schumannella soli TaxID=2590779 RepID=A0A506XY35_9MICO|nr:SDR family oxidoreductase [Schumannella soli]TPW74612.1 SDR family oxidoreductase [Schumannella soli]
MIVITGATGAFGGATVEHLLAELPASEIAVVARDVTTAQRFAERGVEVREGDYARPATLPAAFAHAEQLLLVSSSDPHADAVALHRTAIDAAVDAGVGRVLYTSHQGAAPTSPFFPAQHHHATEQLLAQSGLAWTSLRNGFYLHSLTWLLGPWQQTGVIAVPADGPVSWTSRDDEAEAAARILLAGRAGGAARFDGPVTLTANAAPTFAEIAAIAGEVTGREITSTALPEEEWIAQRVADGQPEPMVRFLLGMYQAAGAGLFAGTDPLLAELLGREPASVRDFLTAEG